GILSLGALFANLLIIPLSSLALIAGFASLVSGLFGALSLSALFNSAAVMILIAADWLVVNGTAIPGMYFDAEFRRPWMTRVAIRLGTSTLLACLGGGWRRRYGGFWPPFILVAILVIFGVKFGAE